MKEKPVGGGGGGGLETVHSPSAGDAPQLEPEPEAMETVLTPRG